MQSKTYTIKYSPDHGDNIYELAVEAESRDKARVIAWHEINSCRPMDMEDISFKTFLEWLTWAAR